MNARTQPVKDRIVEQAAALTIAACDACPMIHINLHDEAGEVFATAVVAPDAIGFISGRFAAVTDQLKRRVPTAKRMQ